MDHDRDPEHSPTTPGPSLAPELIHDTEVSARGSGLASQATTLSGGGVGATGYSPPTLDQPTHAPGPGPSTPSASVVAPLATFASSHGPFAPASGSNGSPSRSIPRIPALSFDDGDMDQRRGPPLPPLPHDMRVRNSRLGLERSSSPGPRSGIDYIVPVDEKATRQKTVGERLHPTLLTAIAERDKYAFKAKMTGYALNAAIAIQVLLGALTTGLATVTTGRQTSITTAILGGLATLTASYLARARGSNEPELSITRVKDLEQFVRECEAFQMDHGHTLGDKYDQDLEDFRRRFEELLGNANGERRLAPPV